MCFGLVVFGKHQRKEGLRPGELANDNAVLCLSIALHPADCRADDSEQALDLNPNHLESALHVASAAVRKGCADLVLGQAPFDEHPALTGTAGSSTHGRRTSTKVFPS
jgi:hypothetical protein